MQNIIAVAPIRKTTLRLPPEARAIADQLPQRTLNKAVTSLLLLVGRQRRALDGVGPDAVPSFLRKLGAEVPSWYEYQHDRDKAAKAADDDKAARESWKGAAAYKAKLKRAALSARLKESWAHAQRDQGEEERQRAEVERLELEEVARAYQEELKRTATVQKPSPKLEGIFTQTKAQTHPGELEKRSPRLSKLVLLASVRCLSFLTLLASETLPDATTEALEAALEARLELSPAPAPKARKRLWWLDLS